MKKIWFSFTMLGFWLSQVKAQNTVQVPDVVSQRFHTDFSSVARWNWIKESDNVYFVDFSIYKNRHAYTARYDSTGNWLEKKIEIDFSQLPMTVKEQLVVKFENFKPVKSVVFEVRNSKPTYQVTIIKWQPGDDYRETYAVEMDNAGEMLREPELLARASTE